MNLRCKPGDLAIVIKANYECNLGLVVKVMEPAPELHPWRVKSAGHSWWVKSKMPMFYTKADVGKCVFLLEGPVPDKYLMPIGTAEPVLNFDEEATKTIVRSKTKTKLSPI